MLDIIILLLMIIATGALAFAFAGFIFLALLAFLEDLYRRLRR